MPRRRSLESRGLATLREALAGESVDALKSRARMFGIRGPTRKADLVAQLSDQLEGPRLTAFWEKLSTLSRHAVAEIIHGDGECLDPMQFEAKYGDVPSWYAGEPGYKTEPGPLSMLVFAEGWIPDDLKRRLKPLAPQPEEPTIRTVDKPPGRISAGPGQPAYDVHCQQTSAAALHDVRAMLHLVASGRLPVGAATGQVGPAGVKAILPVLRNGDYFDADSRGPDSAQEAIRAFAWPLLLQAGGLARTRGSKLELTRAGEKALSSPAHELLRQLWKRWLEATNYDELQRITPLKGLNKRAALHPVRHRRMTIASMLEEVEPGRWIEVREFLRHLAASGNELRVARDSWKLYIGHPEHGSLGYQDCDQWLPHWYLMIFLWEYAATLGLIDVAYADPQVNRRFCKSVWGVEDFDYLCVQQGLVYFRVNDLGAWILGQTEDFSPPAEESRALLRVLPNFEVAATDQLNPPDRALLERFSKRRSERVWALSLQSLMAAAANGLAPAEVRAFLTARCADALPDTVADLFDQAESRLGCIRDSGPARLFECRDAELAALLSADTTMASLCHRAGERLLAVPVKLEPRFRSGLRRLGYVVPRS